MRNKRYIETSFPGWCFAKSKYSSFRHQMKSEILPWMGSSNSWLLSKPRAIYILSSPTYKASAPIKYDIAGIHSKSFTMVRYTLLGYPPVYFIALLGAMKLGLLLRLQAAWQQTFPEHIPREVEFSGYALSNTIYISDLITGYLGADYPRELPMAPLRNVETFIEDSVHYQLNGTAADSEWETLFPGNGLIVLGPHEQVFSISMFINSVALTSFVMHSWNMVEFGVMTAHQSSFITALTIFVKWFFVERVCILMMSSVGGSPKYLQIFTNVMIGIWCTLAVKESQRIHSKHR